MEQRLVIELIRTLTKEERDVVLQFAAISFFNNGKYRVFVPKFLMCAFNWVSEDTAFPDKITIYETIFPNQIFFEGKLEKLMVEVNKLIRLTLLAMRYFKPQNEFMQNFDFAKIVFEKDLIDRHSLLLGKLQKSLNEAPAKNQQILYFEFLLENEKHDRELFFNQKKGDVNILNTLESLDLHDKAYKIVILNRLFLQQKLTPVQIAENQQHLLEVGPIPESYLEKSAVLRINYFIYNVLKAPSVAPDTIQQLFLLIQKHEKNLDIESIKEFYTYLRNICILVLGADYDNKEAESTLLNLYKDNLPKGYLHNEGKMVPSRYWSVGNIAIRAGDLDWAYWFINSYKNEIVGDNETQDIYRLSLANYYFAIKDFEKCLENVPPSSPYSDFLITGKQLEIKCYYELMSDLLHYKLDSFKVFLSRTSSKLLSEHQKQINVDFVNFMTQIVATRPGDIKRAEKILNRLDVKKLAGNRRWLVEKAQELKNAKP